MWKKGGRLPPALFDGSPISMSRVFKSAMEIAGVGMYTKRLVLSSCSCPRRAVLGPVHSWGESPLGVADCHASLCHLAEVTNREEQNVPRSWILHTPPKERYAEEVWTRRLDPSIPYRFVTSSNGSSFSWKVDKASPTEHGSNALKQLGY